MTIALVVGNPAKRTKSKPKTKKGKIMAKPKRKTSTKKASYKVSASKKRSPVKRKSNPASMAVSKPSTKRRVMTRPSNPTMFGDLFDKQIKPALIGGAAAVGGNLAFEMALSKFDFIPEQLKTGNGRIAANAAFFVGIGLVMKKMNISDKKTREAIVTSGLTVTVYEAARKVATEQGWIEKLDGYQNMQNIQTIQRYRTTNLNKPGESLRFSNTNPVYKATRQRS